MSSTSRTKGSSSTMRIRGLASDVEVCESSINEACNSRQHIGNKRYRPTSIQPPMKISTRLTNRLWRYSRYSRISGLFRFFPVRIMLVDDDPFVRDVAVMALSAVRGVTVAAHGSGADALAAAYGFAPNLLLLD